MTSRSTYGGRRKLDSAILDDDAPIDAGVAALLANNVIHAADESARVWVNWCAPTAAYKTGSIDEFIEPLSGDVVTGGWFQVRKVGPIPLSVFRDGTPYLLRVRIAGAVSAVAGDVTFAVGTGPPGGVLDEVLAATERNYVRYDDISSTTPADLTPVEPASGILSIDQARVEASIVARPTLVDTGGESGEVEAAEFYVFVWAKTTNVTSVPQLWKLHVAEYVG